MTFCTKSLVFCDAFRSSIHFIDAAVCVRWCAFAGTTRVFEQVVAPQTLQHLNLRGLDANMKHVEVMSLHFLCAI